MWEINVLTQTSQLYVAKYQAQNLVLIKNNSSPPKSYPGKPFQSHLIFSYFDKINLNYTEK